MAKICAFLSLLVLSSAAVEAEGVRRTARTVTRFKQLLKVAMSQKKEQEKQEAVQPYGPWTSKNFSKEALKLSPCGQDGKSSAFDSFKMDKGPSKNTSNESFVQMGQPYGPWTSKNFSKEALKLSPCGQDGKSSAFDSFKMDKGPSKNTSNESFVQLRH